MASDIRVVKYATIGRDPAGDPVQTRYFPTAAAAHTWAEVEAQSPFFTVVYEKDKATAWVR